MSALETWIQRRLAALLLWMLAGGFVMLLAELLLTAHTDGVQLVGVVASGAGLALTLAALAVGGRARYAVAALLLVLSVSGLLGTLQHYGARSEEEAASAYHAGAPTHQTVALRAQDDDDGAPEGEEGASAPPPLAPLSLSGLSLMAAVSSLGSGKPRV